MSNKNIALGILTVVAVSAILVAVYFYYEDKQKKIRIVDLETDKLKLILDSLRRNRDLSDEVKSQLEKLIYEFQKIDIDVAEEISQALQLFQIGQVENAIEDLVKIIGHLLEKYYSKQNGFAEWFKKERKNKSRIDLHDLLTYCHKVDKKINEVEYQFFVAIKTIRNKEDHQVNLKLDNYLNASGIITAIGAVIKFAKIVYPAKQEVKQIK